MVGTLGFPEMAKSFAQNLRYFRANFFLRTFALFLRMKQNEFCEVFRYFFGAICTKTEIFFAKCCAWNEILVLCNFLHNFRKTASFTQNVTFRQIVKIDILSLELNNWRFIPYMKKILTYEYDNDYTTLNWLLPVTKSLN